MVAYDGKVYSAPHNIDQILVYDVETKALSGIPVTQYFASGRADSWCGILEHQGKLYMAPHSSEYIVVYEPETGEVSGISTASVATGLAKWIGLAEESGKLYSAPYNAEQILVFDPRTREVSGVSTSAVTRGGRKWMGTIAHEGKIYAAPMNSNQLLVYDVNLGMVSGVATDHVFKGDIKWHGMVLHEGKIYAAPSSAEQLLVYDPATGALSGVPTTSVDSNEQCRRRMLSGAVAIHANITLAPTYANSACEWKWSYLTAHEGKLFAAPLNSEALLVYDTRTQLVSGIPLDGFATGIPSANKWRHAKWNGILAYKGMLYAAPFDAQYMLAYRL
eukprot:gnl/TRDRNA2_/TRDRNA2_73514_c1_seq1.p1 gnl/TRDRNA2_/TRDRNA2_73514_c1~~gnl/TRDRNA2_/TRDRNA2_73514_c1_seq1.p1  ORF type:complete len:376 (-),score=60.31 gnl/TRDRNA2_/TRDRNA2_73514_c1_seq1:37-1035(-)